LLKRVHRAIRRRMARVAKALGYKRPATQMNRPVERQAGEAVKQAQAFLKRVEKEAERGEVAYSSLNRTLLDLEASVQGEMSPVHNDSLSLVVFAQLATALQNWEAATVRWTQVLRDVPRWRVQARLELSVAYRNLGSTAKAAAWLRKIKHGDLPEEILQAEQERIAKAESAEVVRVLGNRLVHVIHTGESGDNRDALIEGISTVSGDPTIASALRMAVRQEVRSTIEPAISSTPHSSNSLFFCGFGWSGSGALFDYYRQSSNSVLPVAGAELGVFERNTSVMTVLSAAAEDPQRVWPTIVDFIASNILGVSGEPDHWATSNSQSSLLTALRSSRCENVDTEDIILRFVSTLVAGKNKVIDQQGARSLLSSAFGQLFRDTIPDGAIGLFSNCITGANVDLIQLVPGARAVTVKRDVRDQYVSQRYEFRGRTSTTAKGFIAKIKRRDDLYRSALERIGEPAKTSVFEVWFEDFVSDERTRRSLESWMGIPAPSSTGNGYVPSDSRPNVGIHKKYPLHDELELIAKALPHLCRAD
jgi:hypothetical protein